MENLINVNFWSTLYEKLQLWAITDLPPILITTVLFIVLYQILRLILRKLKLNILNKNSDSTNVSTLEEKKRSETLVGILEKILKVSLWIVYLLMILNKFGVNVGPLLASVGFVGLALGFGAQELVRDMISGFFILLEDQIRNGDVAIINGTGGLVEKIDLRTITLRDFSGVVHIFQNGKIDTLANMTKEWSAMVLDIGVAYKENIDYVLEVMAQVSKELEEDEEYGKLIIEPIEVLGVDALASSSVNIKVRIKTKPISQWYVGRAYRKKIKETFDEKGIEIPFPHQTIYWGEKIDALKIKNE